MAASSSETLKSIATRNRITVVVKNRREDSDGKNVNIDYEQG